MEYPRKSQFKSHHKYQLALREWRVWNKRRLEPNMDLATRKELDDLISMRH